MSSNQRPHAIVGTGTLREPDEEKFTVNEGWSFFQQYMPDNSIIDSESFSYNVIGIEGDGPYICQIPAMPDCFLDPSSLRLEGTCKIVHYKDNVEQAALPKHAAYKTDNFQNAKLELKLNEDQNTEGVLTELNKLNPDQLFQHENKNLIKLTNDKYYELHLTKTFEESPEVSKVFPVNLMCQAMWRDIEIKLNSRTVTKNPNLEYANKAYLETLMTYGNDALNTHMQSEMWVPDDPEEIKNDNYMESYHKTKAAKEKASRYCQNNEFSFCMQLHTEFNSINGFIMDQMPYRFQFVKNDPKFFLMTNKDDDTCKTNQYYKLKISSLKLTGNFVKPSEEVMKLYRAHLASYTPFLYQTTRTDVLINQFPSGVTRFDWNDIFASDYLPDTIYCAMVDMDAKNGSFYKDPFYFDHNNIESIYLRVNNKNIPVDPLTPNWSNDDYINTYKELYENCSIKLNNVGLSITPEKFKNGSTIFAWDLNHDKCGGAHANHGNMIGTASLHMLFPADAIKKNVCVIVWGVFRDYLAIDNERKPNVLTSYGVEQYYTKLGLPVPKFKQFL